MFTREHISGVLITLKRFLAIIIPILPGTIIAEPSFPLFKTTVFNGNLIVNNEKIIIIDKDRHSILFYEKNGKLEKKKSSFTFLDKKIRFNGELAAYSHSSGLLFYSNIHESLYLTDQSLNQLIKKIDTPEISQGNDLYFINYSTLFINKKRRFKILAVREITENKNYKKTILYKRTQTLIGITNYEELIFFDKNSKTIFYLTSPSETTRTIPLPKTSFTPLKAIEHHGILYVLPRKGKAIYKYDFSIDKWDEIKINFFDREYQDFEKMMDFFIILEKDGGVIQTKGEIFAPY